MVILDLIVQVVDLSVSKTSPLSVLLGVGRVVLVIHTVDAVGLHASVLETGIAVLASHGFAVLSVNEVGIDAAVRPKHPLDAAF